MLRYAEVFHLLMTSKIRIKFKGFTAALSFRYIIYSELFQSNLQFSSDYHFLTWTTWRFSSEEQKKKNKFNSWHQYLSSGKCSGMLPAGALACHLPHDKASFVPTSYHHLLQKWAKSWLTFQTPKIQENLYCQLHYSCLSWSSVVLLWRTVFFTLR